MKDTPTEEIERQLVKLQQVNPAEPICTGQLVEALQEILRLREHLSPRQKPDITTSRWLGSL